MVTRYAKRVDANHADIRAALKAIGVGVIDNSAAGDGLPDFICFWRGQTVWIEAKDGEKSSSRRKLTIAQVQFHDTARKHGVTVHVVTSVADALAVFGAR